MCQWRRWQWRVMWTSTKYWRRWGGKENELSSGRTQTFPCTSPVQMIIFGMKSHFGRLTTIGGTVIMETNTANCQHPQGVKTVSVTCSMMMMYMLVLLCDIDRCHLVEFQSVAVKFNNTECHWIVDSQAPHRIFLGCVFATSQQPNDTQRCRVLWQWMWTLCCNCRGSMVYKPVFMY